MINVDKNAAYPKAIDELKAKKTLPEECELRQCKYLNNIVEQDHRGIKRLTNILIGVERRAVQKRVKFIAEIFKVAA